MTTSLRRFEGILWILLASASFATMGAFTKAAVAAVGVADVVFWRSVIVAVVAFALAWRQGVSWRPGNVRLMLWRSFVGLVAMGLFFWSIGQIELGLAHTLLYTSPLFTVLLSGRLLGESGGWRRLVPALVAFAGVALVVRPDLAAVELGSLAALGAGLLAALAYIAVRRLRTSDPPARVVWFFAVFSALGTAPFALGDGFPTDTDHIGLLLAVGVFAAGGQLAMTRAYAVEEATIVGPFSNATVIFAWLLGLLLWDESLGWSGTLGMALVVLACAWLGRYGGGSGRSADQRPGVTAAPRPP